ncbi:1,6-anhydro-N-acetylmuramyl-L-alanine amidase AmpD [Pulveribacter sp.]|uniref:1,6-anhydro-N-acetylmuramyl-L-alanine amidase AmpD n=1 Tax=Pulveribacter sp. TaxID=2678893 RepID=UPI0028AB36B9|nr:1,6-anhydro-N-acetylmuramyl-L-alanine amidase AmpD [Pulveribacter sp.]
MATRSSGPWRGGWLAGARRLPSPNEGERPAGAQVDLIVVHSISLPPGSYGGGQVQRLFTNRLDWDAHPYFMQIAGLQVSSHFFIERTGVVWQFVDAERRAWHAGRSHYRGRDNCNDDSVGIELEGLEGLRFEPAQYAALLRLCRALMQRFPIRFIAGHEHIAPQRKDDPGSGFEWHRMWRALAGSGVLLPPGTAARP